MAKQDMKGQKDEQQRKEKYIYTKNYFRLKIKQISVTEAVRRTKEER